MPLLPEQTVPYKTWIKTSLVEGLRQVFSNHPDARIQTHDVTRGDGTKVTAGTKVSIEYPTSELHYPAVMVRFFEREVFNAGVGHVEYIYLDDANPNFTYKFRHYLYDGDIEFVIMALSSLDRDLISDSLIQALAMPDMADYTFRFWNRIYFPTDTDLSDPIQDTGAWNYVNLNTDKIQGFGETQTPQPWLSEDQLVYQTSYRTRIYGEFYSLPPKNIPPAGPISKVNLIPYSDYLGDPVPTGRHDEYWDTPDGPPRIEDTTGDPGQWA